VTDRCAVPGCRGEVELIYLDRGLCDSHWTEMNADDVSRVRLRMVLGLDATPPPATEADMSENENNAAENAATEEPMPAKKTEVKAPKKARAAKAAKATTAKKSAKPPKEPKARKERPPKGPVPNRVFAIRVTDAELDAIHRASGPRNATRMIRAVAAAFAAEDTKAFEAVIAEAKTLRG